MNLKQLNDSELLSQTKSLVENERQLLTKVLYHLLEIDRRKLFSDFGYQSLFEYAVKELKYSEGQAGRRIQAMRLLKELPQKEQMEIEKKIESGALSLSNISQAQNYFREAQKFNIKNCANHMSHTQSCTSQAGHAQSCASQISHVQSNSDQTSHTQSCASHTNHSHSCTGNPSYLGGTVNTSNTKIPTFKKIEVLKALENKSAREGQKLILSLKPEYPLPKERERVVTNTHTEIRFIIDDQLKAQLEELRALLGTRGAQMSFSELISYMTKMSIHNLKVKKFGKKRVEAESQRQMDQLRHQMEIAQIEGPKVFAKTGCEDKRAHVKNQDEINQIISQNNVQDPKRPSSHYPSKLTLTSESQPDNGFDSTCFARLRNNRKIHTELSKRIKSNTVTDIHTKPTPTLESHCDNGSGNYKYFASRNSTQIRRYESASPRSAEYKGKHEKERSITKPTLTLESRCESGTGSSSKRISGIEVIHNTGSKPSLKSARYIPRDIQHEVWLRDKAQCSKCGSQRHLNIDHIMPVALGGSCAIDNLRLLCFSCNQRQAIKTFGVRDQVQKFMGVKASL